MTNSNLIPVQFNFEIYVNSVSLEYTSPLSLRVSFKKDKTEVETKKTLKYEPPGRKELVYKEKLSISATLYKDKQANNYQDKPAKMYLEVYTSKGYKPAGFSELNLKDYVDFKEYQMLDIKVLKCADKNSTINIGIKSHHSVDSENLEFSDDEVEISNISLMSMGIHKNMPSFKQTEQSFLNDSLTSQKLVVKNGNSHDSPVKLIKSPGISISTGTNEDKEKNKEIENLKNKLEDNVKIKVELTKELSIRIEEINKLKSENDVNKITLSDLEKEKNNLKSSLENINKLYSELKSSKGTNTSRIYEELEEKNRIIEELKESLDYNANRNAELEVIIKDIKAQKKTEYDEKIAQIKELKSELDKKSHELEETERQVKLKENAYVEIENKYKSVQEKSGDLNYENDKLLKDNKDLLNQLNNLKKSFNEKEAIYKNEINTLNNKLTAKQEEFNKLENDFVNEKEQLQVDLMSITNRNKGFENKIEELQIDYENKIKLMKEDKENIINEKDAEISRLKEKIGFYENYEKQNFEKNLISSQQNMVELQEKINHKEEEIHQLTTQIEELNSKTNKLEEISKKNELDKENYFTNFNNMEKKYKDEIINIKSKLDEKDGLLQTQMYDKDILRIEVDKLKNEIKSLNSNKQNDEAIFIQFTDLQNKYAEREKKLIEEKENEIKSLKKENENALNNLKKASTNYDKEIEKNKSEIEFLKQKINHLRSEENEFHEHKEKMLKFEKNYLEIQNMLVQKKVEISQVEMERDKLKLEVTTLQNDKNKQISLVEDLEKDLVLTKQKLGEVLNELSEAEQAKINTERIGEKKGKYSFFSKKK